MKLEQAEILIQMTTGLVGKKFNENRISAIFICDSNRQDLPEIIENVINVYISLKVV